MTVLVIGGAASGKSEFAEELCVRQNGERFYIATMEPFGDEGAKRISRHREMRRERGFTTIERFTNLAGMTMPSRGTVLLEDIGNLVANEIFTVGGDGVAERVADGIMHVAAQCDTLIVVSNDVLRAAEPGDTEMENYLATIGRVNRLLAAKFDEVYEVVSGFAERMK